MSWINSLAPWQWFVMLAVPPLIVLLYFLKLKRSPMVVPSTYLWRRTIEDLQVNSLWQRLRKNLLLLLQLLFVLALIIACLRPGIRSTQSNQTRRIFLLDTSASMQAVDVQPSRFDAACKAISDQIDNMTGDEVAMLIAFSNRADVRQGFTSDRGRLKAALKSTQVTNRTSDIAEALRAASGLANPGRSSFNDMTDLQVAEAKPATIEIYSDGRFANVDDFGLGNLSPKFIAIGTPTAENIGIVAFSIERLLDESNAAQCYGRIENASQTDKTISVELRAADQLLDATELTIPAKQTRGVSFQISEPAEGESYTLRIDGDDMLPLDNVATASLRPDRQMQILVVSDGGQALQTAFATSVIGRIARVTFIAAGQYKLWSDSNFAKLDGAQLASSSAIDLVVFDSVGVEVMPPANTFVFGGAMSEATKWKTGPEVGPLLIVDWDRSSEIMQYATIGNLRIVQGHSVTGPEGSRILVRGDNGPLLVTAPRGPYVDAVMGFGLKASVNGESITNTDWPIKRSFPVFLLSLLQNLGGGNRQMSSQNLRPGEPALINIPPSFNEIAITDPRGNKQLIQRDVGGQIVSTATDQPGLYRVTRGGDDGELIDVFTVNLASSEETKIAISPKVELGYQDVAATKSTTPKRREYWRWLLGMGLVLLVVEWTIFSRRI